MNADREGEREERKSKTVRSLNMSWDWGGYTASEQTHCIGDSELIRYSYPAFQGLSTTEGQECSLGESYFKQLPVCLISQPLIHTNINMWPIIIFSYWVTTENILARVLNLKMFNFNQFELWSVFLWTESHQSIFLYLFFCFSYPRQCLL